MKNVARIWTDDPRADSKPFPTLEAFMESYKKLDPTSIDPIAFELV
jgi:hypothetical protein